jgi:hypothetical protein
MVHVRHKSVRCPGFSLFSQPTQPKARTPFWGLNMKETPVMSNPSAATTCIRSFLRARTPFWGLNMKETPVMSNPSAATTCIRSFLRGWTPNYSLPSPHCWGEGGFVSITRSGRGRTAVAALVAAIPDLQSESRCRHPRWSGAIAIQDPQGSPCIPRHR